MKLLLVLLLASASFAQDVHKFFDKPARFTLSTSASIFTTDAVTSCIHNGHEEWLPVQSCQGISLWMGMNFAETVGTAYLFHRTKHHKLERIAEIVAPIGSALGIAATLRSHQPQPKVRIVPVFTNPTFCIVGKTC